MKKQVTEMEKGRIATVGTFDGVHKGHKKVLETLCNEGGKRGLLPMVFTFDRHPLSVVAPEKAPGILMLPEDRDKILKTGSLEVSTIHFDEATAAMSASHWIKKVAEEYNVKALVLGYDNTFGHDGVSLSIDDYRELGKEYGVEVIEAPVVEGISSSAVRKAVKKGDVEGAALMLGRPHYITGIVVHGNALGRSIGWPTANLHPDPRLAIPSEGVYAALCELPDGKEYCAMVNIGHRPTIGSDSPLTIEAHLIHFSGSLYSLPVKLHFIARIREEMKFSGLDELKEALSADQQKVISIFKDKDKVWC